MNDAEIDEQIDWMARQLKAQLNANRSVIPMRGTLTFVFQEFFRDEGFSLREFNVSTLPRNLGERLGNFRNPKV